LIEKSHLMIFFLISTIIFSITNQDAFAAVEMFLNIEGIEGESKDKTHVDEIDVLAWSWGPSIAPSPAGGRERRSCKAHNPRCIFYKIH